MVASHWFQLAFMPTRNEGAAVFLNLFSQSKFY